MIALIIIIAVVMVAMRFIWFAQELKQDIKDITEKSLPDRFETLLGILNSEIFEWRADVTITNQREFILYDGYNQIICFHYSTGHLTIKWKFKFLQQEVVYNKTIYHTRSITENRQKDVANLLIKEMDVIIEKHKIKVLNS